MTQTPWLSLLIFVPWVMALGLACFYRKDGDAAKKAALVFSLLPALVTLFLVGHFDAARAGMQFVERHDWIPSLAVEYCLGLDGFSLPLVILTTILVPFAILASWQEKKTDGVFYALILFLQGNLYGVFTALNFFPWFLFWEMSLIPAFFLIRIWGGQGRIAAATPFFIYTMLGSAAMLLSFLALYISVGTFDFVKLAELGRTGVIEGALYANLGLTPADSNMWVTLVFFGVLLGVAVKVPLFPFHSWLPAAYAEAPTSVTILLTGALSKMGVYGFLRLLLPIFPGVIREWLEVLLALALAGIIFSAFAALFQKDLKRMLAYSSINHLGYCLLGIFAAAASTHEVAGAATEIAATLNGVVVQMFSHGISAAALFCFVGWIETRGGGLRGLEDFGGLRKAAPIFCGLFGISAFSSLGLPGLNGFIGEFLIFKGVFALVPWAAVGATVGLLVTALFLLTCMEKVFHGPLPEKWEKWPDLSLFERVTMLPLAALMFVIGLCPQMLVGLVNPCSTRMAEWLSRLWI